MATQANVKTGRPRLLDLFCGAGGASAGYRWSGFEVVGVDIKPQPRYPFEFIQADALSMDPAFLASFDAIHASPPCQAFTAYRRKGMGVGSGYPDLIEPVREMLRESGKPYVIENVGGAPLIEPVRYCGSAFKLDVRRHRYFESNIVLEPPPCNHKAQRAGRFPGATNRAPFSRATVEIGVWRIPLETQRKAMGIDWMALEELSEAIPPAYTDDIGEQLIFYLWAMEAV